MIKKKRTTEHAHYVKVRDARKEKSAKLNNAIFFGEQNNKPKDKSVVIDTDNSFKAIKELSDTIESKSNIYTDKIELAANGSISERVNIIMKTLHQLK
jgi:hypothetical protein